MIGRGHDTSDALYNPPYQPAIRYRIGDFERFVRALLERLPTQRVPGRPSPPLAGLYLEPAGNWIVALAAVWAEVGDILAFYQERIANEGFLGTATLPESVNRILQSVGYDTATHVAAETDLAYSVSLGASGIERVARNAGVLGGQPGRGARTAQNVRKPDKQAAATDHRPARLQPGPATPVESSGTTAIPSGAQIQSIAQGDRLPQIFEALEAIVATGSWNGLLPATPATPELPVLTAHTTMLRLAGVRTKLAVGKPVLITGADPATGAPVSWIRFLTAVTPDPNLRFTTVAWQAPLGNPLPGDPGPPAPIVTAPQVFGFDDKAPLFGHDAAQWNSLGDARKRAVAPLQGGVLVSSDGGDSWTARNDGLPIDTPTAVYAYADALYVATATNGVFIATGGGAFAASSAGMSRRNLLSVSAGGGLLAGGVGGGAFRSVDGGASWDSIAGGPPTLRRKSKTDIQVSSNQLPATNVRALHAVGEVTYAATDRGVFRHDGSNWRPDGITEAAFAVLEADVGVIAATASGVQRRTPKGSWTALGTGLRGEVEALAVGDRIVAGTPSGVWFLDGGAWRRRNGTGADAIPDDAGSVTALAAVGATVWAGTARRGLYRSRDHGATWQRIDVQRLFTASADEAPSGASAASPQSAAPLAIPEALRLRFSRAGYPLSTRAAATAIATGWTIADGPRVYRVVRDGQRLVVSRKDALPQVTAVFAAGVEVVAAGPFAGFAADEWPGFALSGVIDLARVAPAIVAGSWAVLAEDGASGSRTSAHAIRDVQRIMRRDFGRADEITRLLVTPASGLSAFGLRDTDAWVHSRALPLYSPIERALTPVSGAAVELDRQVETPLPLPRRAVITGKSINAAVAPVGGVFARAAGGAWTRIALAQANVRALAVDRAGNAYAGTSSAGAFAIRHAVAGPATVTPLIDGLSAAAVPALAIQRSAGAEAIVAATPTGVFRRTGPTGAWSAAGLAGRDVTALVATTTGGLVAGTRAGGVFHADPGGDQGPPAWMAAPPLDRPITAVAATGDAIFAGTADGVFTRTGDGPWRALERGLDNRSVSALLVDDRSGGVLVATDGGVFRYAPARGEWIALGSGVAPVQALFRSRDGALYAGTRGGVYAWSDAGAEWTQVPTGASNDVRALIDGPGGVLWMGVRDAAVLTSPDRREVELGQDFLFTVIVRNPDTFAALDQETLPGEVADAFTRARLTLAAAPIVIPRQLGATWLLRSENTVFVLALWQLAAPGAALRVYRNRAIARVTAAPVASGALTAWQLEDKLGAGGALTAAADELVLLAAAADDPLVSEAVVITDQQPRPGGRAAQTPRDSVATTLTLSPALAGYYDAATVAIRCNVVRARHGAQVTQVLGSGDATKAHQQFTIPGPVAATAEREPGAAGEPADHPLVGAPQTTLSILVDGVPWTRVSSLASSGPDDQVHVLAHLADGGARVTFGDGVHGARLPTGRENVVARYRHGGGPAGELHVGSLLQLRTRPQLVERAHNITAATAPATSVRRDQIAASMRTLGRVVTRADAQDYGLAFPGVTKARADAVPGPAGRVMALTIAGDQGVPPAKLDALRGELAAAIASVRGPGAAIEVLAYERRLFNVSVRLFAAPGADPEADARAALADAFGFSARRLGADVVASEIVAALQRVPGIRGVDLTALYSVGDTPSLRPALPGSGARWDARRGRVRGAVLHILNPIPAGVVVDVADADDPDVARVAGGTVGLRPGGNT